MHGEELQRGVANDGEPRMLHVAEVHNRRACGKYSWLFARELYGGALENICCFDTVMNVQTDTVSGLVLTHRGDDLHAGGTAEVSALLFDALGRIGECLRDEPCGYPETEHQERLQRTDP